jgi:tetratricopeptide (TPR) repeat protein
MLNNDTLVTPGWLNTLLETAEGDDNVAMVGAKLLYPDNSVQHAGVVFNQAGKVYHQYRYFYRDHPAVNKTREFQVLTTACLLIRTSVFLQVGLFDENFRNGFEDVDLCLRVRQLGYRMLYNPNCVVYHLESMTIGRFDREIENSQYFQEKWQDRIVPDDYIYYQEDGLRLEWTVNGEGLGELLIHDENENPFKKKARAHLDRGEIAEALALYNLALRFNPFDPRNRSLITEIETLKALGEPQNQAVHA